MRRHMAFLAGQPCVLALQRISRLFMVELLQWRVPVDERKLFTVVVQMAADAILAIGVFHFQPRVIAMLFGERARNFLVTLKTFEGRRAGSELVTAGALRCPAERLMRFGEWARRNLPAQR